jgi:cell division protein FtsI/penicillin-binding protein 2
MWAWTTTAWAAWKKNSTDLHGTGPHVHRHGRAPQGARFQRARARTRPQPGAHHRRKHSVHGRARARSHHGKDPGRSTAPWWCRTCTPARFWRLPFGPRSIPTSFATPRRPAARPRRQRRLRAGLDLQAGHVCRGDGPARGYARRHDRLPGRPDHDLAGRVIHDKGRSRHRHGSGGHGARSLQRRGVSSWRSKSAPTASINTFATSASVSAPTSSCPAKRAACCGRPQVAASSIGSIAIGQEEAVTPVQLVTMVSTIANGGVYLPPHVLMPDAPTDSPSQSCRTAGARRTAVAAAAQPFKLGERHAQSPARRRASRHHRWLRPRCAR